ncbi:MAG TPA: glycine cleavage T C-terminal barrel domain-containing protein [Pyrinomonadaceae bacterium]|nr:glycine cleavage T C-terminal barrel domain-containing protein [Pyrinomonadaceae bacterium]
MAENIYEKVRGGTFGYRREARGLFGVSGSESLRFLDGLITNDVKTLEDGGSMLAAFPNAQGRLLAAVSFAKSGERFIIETEAATREKLQQNLYRFTFAGDFILEDLSETHTNFEVFGDSEKLKTVAGSDAFIFGRPYGAGFFIPNENAAEFEAALNDGAEIDNATFETLRIECGIPLYGKDMDETTVVPELGIDEMISYKKGCYIGQEIIARIHFRGHIAKRLSGLTLSKKIDAGSELKTAEDKNAGHITSVAFSPKLDKHIALGFVRYDFLGDGTKLFAGETECVVSTLPFI